MEKKFKVGDRVRMVKEHHSAESRGPAVGAQGVIIAVDYICKSYCVEFDRAFQGGHSGGIFVPDGKKGHCWHVNSVHIELVKPEKIIIYRNGDTVVAKDVTTGKTAKAVCSKDDTFDFTTGARLAFDRLITPEVEPEHKKMPLLNCKFAVVKSGSADLTTGRIYEVKDGKFRTDKGEFFPCARALYTFEALRKYLSSEGLGNCSFNARTTSILQIVED